MVVGALAGYLAGLTRPFGVVLAVPAAIEACSGWRRARGRDRVARLAAVVAPVAGLATFLLWVGSFEPVRQQGELRGEWLDPIRGCSRRSVTCSGHSASSTACTPRSQFCSWSS